MVLPVPSPSCFAANHLICRGTSAGVIAPTRVWPRACACACSAMMERAAGQPSWLTSAPAEHATAKRPLPRCDSALLFIPPPPLHLNILYPPCRLPPGSFHARFPLAASLCASSHPLAGLRAACARLGCETNRDTPAAISKMAEFNGQTLGRYSP